jgi:hypothetical protein
MSPIVWHPTHYTAARISRAGGIEQAIKESPNGIHG